MYLQQKDRKWILVVDDDTDLRESMVELIKQSFGEEVCVVEARDGVEATCKINCQAFDCIVTDIDMPKKEGGAFLTSVKNNLFNEQTPVVVVSGLADKEAFVKDFPFACFIAKPFQTVQFTDVIKNKIKIGKNANGLSANVFNLLISTTLSFLEGLTNIQNLPTGTPKLKSIGTDVVANSIASIQVKSGKSVCTFSILLTDNVTERIVSQMKQQPGKSLQEIQQSMSQVILNHVMKKSSSTKDSPIQVHAVNWSKDSLKDKRGILVPLGSEDMQIQIFATNK